MYTDGKREKILAAIQSERPFSILVDDGRAFEISRPFQIALGKINAVVVDERDCPRLVPLNKIINVN
jgi:hypothetical protein